MTINRIRLTIISLILIVVTISAYNYLFLESPQTDLKIGTKLGEVATDFTLTNLDGNSFSLSNFRGKTVIINFMSTTCHFCRVEMPDLVRFQQDYKSKNVVLISLDVKLGSTGSIRQFKKEFGADWIFAPQAEDVARDYKILTIPTKYLIDSNGIIVWKKAGASTYKTLSSEVDALLRN